MIQTITVYPRFDVQPIAWLLNGSESIISNDDEWFYYQIPGKFDGWIGYTMKGVW